MSYDIAVFEPLENFRDRATFLTWYKSRTRWGPRAYDPSNATPRLQSWFNEMIETFPPMNIPNRPSGNDTERWAKVVDYVFAGDMIYIAISGSRATIGRQTITRVAGTHGVGVFELSDAGDVYFPTSSGNLQIAHRDDHAVPFHPTHPLNTEGIDDFVAMLLAQADEKSP